MYPCTNGNVISTSTKSFIGQGYYNYLYAGNYSAILGGFLNCNQNQGGSFIGGGYQNKTLSGYGYNYIGGGLQNCINAQGNGNAIAGGHNNQIQTFANWSGHMGGVSNTMGAYAYLRFTGSWNLANGNNYSYQSYYVSKYYSSFKINHPDPAKTDTHFLHHSTIEAPTRGENLYRYEFTTQNCTASIELPDYFKFLNENEQVWVKPKNNFGNGYGVVDATQSCVTFTTDTEGQFIALILGTRKDWHACNMWSGVERYNTGESESNFVGM